jgi:hypothetical protein
MYYVFLPHNNPSAMRFYFAIVVIALIASKAESKEKRRGHLREYTLTESTVAEATTTIEAVAEESKRRKHKRDESEEVVLELNEVMMPTFEVPTTTATESATEPAAAFVNVSKREKSKEKKHKHEKGQEAEPSGDENYEGSMSLNYDIQLMKDSSKAGKSTYAPTYSPAPSSATDMPTVGSTSSKSQKSEMPPSDAGSKSQKQPSGKANKPGLHSSHTRSNSCGSRKQEQCCNAPPSNRRLLNCDSCRC